MTEITGHQGPLGLLVVGHGTADPVGAEETRAVARAAADLLPGTPVELGFLEVIGPSIDDAMRSLAARRCTRVVAAPLLLFSAGHARRDVPEALVEAAATHGMAVTQSDALGCHPALVALSRRRRAEAMSGLEPVPAADTVPVLLGRGSSAADGVEQFRRWATATLGGDAAVDGQFEIGFAAAARPTLDEALTAAATRGPRRVVVQPHLLFQGHVEGQVTAAVSRCRAAHPQIEWVQVSRLGADRGVARALIDRAAEAVAELGQMGVFSAGKDLSPGSD